VLTPLIRSIQATLIINDNEQIYRERWVAYQKKLYRCAANLQRRVRGQVGAVVWCGVVVDSSSCRLDLVFADWMQDRCL
jgi:hypothetical protein